MAFIACALFALTVQGLLRTSQGMLEDYNYVNSYQAVPTEPAMWSTQNIRGLATWSLWRQVHGTLSPALIRVWNIRLHLLVVLATAWLASRLGVSGLIAGSIMLVHPLTIETLATMSGRFELIAALGLLLACLGATMPAIIGLPLIGIGVVLAIGGKDSAVVGVALVGLCARRPLACGLGYLSVLWLAWTHRFAATLADAPETAGHWALMQATATWRLLLLSVLPRHQTPDFDYDHLSMAIRVIAVLGLVLTVIAAIYVARHHRPILAVGLLWMLIVATPRLIVETPKSYFNEHQWYSALIGYAICISALMSERRPYAENA